MLAENDSNVLELHLAERNLQFASAMISIS